LGFFAAQSIKHILIQALVGSSQSIKGTMLVALPGEGNESPCSEGIFAIQSMNPMRRSLLTHEQNQ